MTNTFCPLSSKFVFVGERDIDTDQILPARFMSTTTSEGLGEHFFYDTRMARKKSGGKHVLDDSDVTERCILVAGPNFGSGSSREHAVWALKDFGFKAVVSPKVADIFKSNALNNGILIIEISSELFEWLAEHFESFLTIDLKAQKLNVSGREDVFFEIDAFAKHCLLKGTDRLGYLLESLPAIRCYEEALRCLVKD